MDKLYRCCAGLDVHKETVAACVRRVDSGGQDYQELGHDCLDQLQPQRLTRYLVKRLESLGHEVILRSVDPAA
jgi:hypothetical protein